MAGFDLSKTQSGTREGIPVISKKGKTDLRYGLYQATLIASMRNSSSWCTLRISLKQDSGKGGSSPE
jgi:hypothetical protein